MSETKETKETKEKSGGSAILLFLLAIGGLWLWKKNKGAAAVATDDTASDYSGGGGSGYGGGGYDGAYEYDIPPAEVVNVVTGGGVVTPGSSSTLPASTTSKLSPVKTVYAARLADNDYQTQLARINLDTLSPRVKEKVLSGKVTTNTLRSMADNQLVQAGLLSPYEYAGGAAAMPGIDPVAYDYAANAYQTARVPSRALVYYAGITGTHRGSMTAAERTAWDSQNLQAALTAYASAWGSGVQADRARELASKTNGTSLSTVKTPTTKTGGTSVQPKTAVADSRKTTTTKGASGLGLGASRGSSQPGKGGTAKTISSGKTTASKGTSALGKGASAGKTSSKK